MSLAACSRRRIPSLQCLARRSITHQAQVDAPSAPSDVSPQSHTTLPPAKMRALISLFHQAEGWITQENLLQRIDQAFVPTEPNTNTMALTSQEGINLADLKHHADARRDSPRLAQLEADKSSRYISSTQGKVWNELNPMSMREIKVFEALYGVKIMTTKKSLKVLPGLEVVKEMGSQLKELRDDDANDAAHREAYVGDFLEEEKC